MTGMTRRTGMNWMARMTGTAGVTRMTEMQ